MLPRYSSYTLAVLLAALAGCQNAPKKVGQVNNRTGNTFTNAPDTAGSVIANTDPSAMNMQNMTGAIFMYYALHKQMPTTLEQLRPLADADTPLSLVVPGTQRPYLYTPDGFLLQDRESRIVVYEPGPMHSGYRLCITLAEPKPNMPMVAKVIALPESFFLLRPPGEAPAQSQSPAENPAGNPLQAPPQNLTPNGRAPKPNGDPQGSPAGRPVAPQNSGELPAATPQPAPPPPPKADAQPPVQFGPRR